MSQPRLEFIGNKAVLKASGKLCTSEEEIIKSDFFKEIINRYIDSLAERHSVLLNIFGEEEKGFFERMSGFFADMKKGGADKKTVSEKREITQEQRDMLILVFSYLCKIKAEEAVKLVPGSEKILSDHVLLFEFAQGLYEYWRKYDRFLLLNDSENTMKPKEVIKQDVEKLTVLVRSTYRNIKDNLSLSPSKIFRQVRAGVEMTAIVKKHPSFPLGGPYKTLTEVPFITNIILSPPLILNPLNNKRKGNYVKVDVNPAETAGVNADRWLCYPAKAGDVLIYVYFNEKFMDLGMSLCNLFELADEEDLKRKPDAVFFYGVTEPPVTGADGMKNVIYEDEQEGIFTASVPGDDEFGYFGYLKKMILTLHNSIMMKRGRMPFHGAFVRVILKGGKSANVLLMGDSGAGKSETIEAFRAIGDEYIQDIIVVADDMGSMEINKKGGITGYGTEIGAFLRIDDLGPGYAFGQLDNAIMMSVSQANARLIIPITPYETVIKGHEVDYIIYANNYDADGEAIERFASPEAAIDVFREGKVMSKGTTTSTGIVGTYFANIFGPPVYKELHEKIASEYFKAFFKKGIYVGQMRTRLGVPGMEHEGPELSARALLDLILKS